MCTSGGCTGKVTTHVTSWANCTERTYIATGGVHTSLGIRNWKTCGASFPKTWWEECDKIMIVTPTKTTQYTICPNHRARLE
ncbi:hypothetical protein BDW74DRAFT_142938 [Aspergillus multicolor]|uniref:uncharacterized protein n=1 Tax=Aspergillus multicolor TaxID=41759 RepID=UPI003CCD34CD